MSRFEQDKEQEARAARQAAQTEAFKVWLSQKHPEVKLTTAIFNEVLEYMGEQFLIASGEDFEYAIQNVGTSYSRQAVPTEDEIKAELINKILALIASADGTGRDGKYDTHGLKLEKEKMQFWSTAELTQRLEEVVRKQELSKKSPAELRNIVQSAREPVSMFPKLPLRMVPRGQVTSVPVDAEYLNGLLIYAEGKHEFVRLVKLFGSDAIDRRRGIK